MPIYRVIFGYILICLKIAIASQNINFLSPDSNYITKKIDSIIQNNDKWDLEYKLMSYNDSLNQIIYKENSIDKIIDTVVIRSKKLISPKILYRAANRIEKPMINDELNFQIRKNKGMMINKYYFLTKAPEINIIRYGKENVGMLIDIYPEFSSKISGIFGMSRQDNNTWDLNGELDLQLENIWQSMERLSFYWKKNDSLNQIFKLESIIPYPFNSRIEINSSLIYELVNGMYTKTEYKIINAVSNSSYGILSFGYETGKINPTTMGVNNYFLSKYKALLVSFNYNNMNARFLPTSGSKLALEIHYGSDDYDDDLYTKNNFLLEHNLYNVGRINLYLKSDNKKIRALGGNLNPGREIRYGGIGNLRGYMDNQFRSSSVYIQTFEMRLKANPFFRSILFFDYGIIPGMKNKLGYGVGISKLSKNSFFEIEYALSNNISIFNGKIHFKWTSIL